MNLSDIVDGVEVLWRHGTLVEYNGDTTRYGSVANQYEGGPCWETPWLRGTLRVVLRQKDLPAGFRQSKYWRKGEIACITVKGQSVQQGNLKVFSSSLDYRMEDVSVDKDDSGQPTGALIMMVENDICEIKLPNDIVPPKESDSTFKE